MQKLINCLKSVRKESGEKSDHFLKITEVANYQFGYQVIYLICQLKI